MLLAICTTQVKKTQSKKEKEKKYGHEKSALRRCEPGPSESVRTKNECYHPLDHISKRYQS